MTALLLDAVQRKGEFKPMADLANPLPVMVIAEMLGVPPERYETFKHQSDVIVSRDNRTPGSPPTPEFTSRSRRCGPISARRSRSAAASREPT